MGELRQRGNVWWVRYYRNGTRYEESSGSSKKGAAIDLLKLREGDGARGVPVTPKIGRLRFEDAAEDVVNDYRINGRRSLAHVERRIRLHLNPVFGGRRMVAITTADVRAFVAQRQAPVTNDDGTETAGASNAEINRELAIVKRAYRLAMQAGKLLYRPHIPMLEERNIRQGFFEREQFEDVKVNLPDALRHVVTFAYLTGWRVPSEILPLQWAQVDRHAETIRLEPGQTKNAEGRLFPYDLLPELHDLIEAQWKEHQHLKACNRICPFVFHRSGEPIRHFRKAWQTACENAGVPGKIPHDFRRTAVRNLVRAGVSERTAMQLTGHKTRSVFDRYDIVNEADLRQAVGRLAPVAGTEKGQSRGQGRIAQFKRARK
ncbi:MAG: site-specific integrase [Acidobacteria bacterium]|nr:site-specific integrase [Acidobacteriota bacterium]